MKRILTFTIVGLLFGGLSLQAEPVPAQRALEIGKRILAAQPATKAGTGQVRIVWDGETEFATKSALPPAFYVVARDGGGFVIIAGDDNATPVLGISDRNTFKVDGMPDNVKWWMERMKDYVRGSKTQTSEVESQWASLIETKAALPTDLISDEYLGSRTCEWDQRAPGNALAPTVTGQENQSVAGCVPVAMAEILTWHGWPNQGVGSSTAYTYTSGNNQSVTVPSYDLETNLVINAAGWEALQALKTKELYSSCSGTTRTNVENLVYACGVILGAKFNDSSNGGTSSSSAAIVAAFGEHMGYNKAAHREFLANQTSLNEWNNKLKLEVSKRPILYRGDSSTGTGNDSGHAYVFDGFAQLTYQGNVYDVFHVNFGWGGDCNGYYFSYYQDPDIPEHYIYQINLEALFDFYPDPTGSSNYINLVNYGGVPGLYFGQPYCDDNYFLVSYALSNNGSTYNGKLVAKLIDRAGNEKVVFDVYKDLNPSSGAPLTDIISDFQSGTYQFGLFLKVPDNTDVDVEFGDRIVLYCSTNAEMTSFKQITGPNDGTVVCELPLVSMPFIKTMSSYHLNDWFKLELMNYDSVYAGSLWTIIDPDGVEHASMLQMEKEFQLTKTGKYKIKVDVRPDDSSDVVETIVTHITVGD